MTPLERGERAKAFFDDPIMKSAYADFRGLIISRLESVNSGDIDAQHELVIQLQVLHGLRAKLIQYETELTVDMAQQRDREFIARAKKSFIP